MIWGLLLSALIVPADTAVNANNQNLDEVVVVSNKYTGGKRSVKGAVASIDEHLRELNHVDLVHRGAYACEPIVNNMQSERLSTTIDGMKIFPACTDKMDPVTSYVESGNLQSISLNSGLYGNPQSTGNIGGSLDLKLRKVGFDNDPFHLNTNIGHEWNGHLQVYGADAAISTHKFYSNFGVFYRHANDYKAGDSKKIDFSQFEKVNAFANLGYRIAEQHILEGTFIYDRASNVGYPALNMDVKKAEGFITSLAYTRLFDASSILNSWQTKVYYNHISHVMDDTHRPNVLIHMDMPGKSRTAGLYSLLKATIGRHDVSGNYDLYYNRQFADMTMYPGGAAPMYMVTWPDVGTLNTGLALNDNITLPHHQTVSVTGKLSWQTQKLNSEEGYKALKVFFPDMKDNYYQVTGRIAASYAWQPGDWRLQAGAGWGNRAPTVTEAYGYYLNNTFDRYDYIGNPQLKNESAVELNAAIGYSFKDESTGNSRLDLGIDTNAFFFTNYIIGHFDVRLNPMTVGAVGVKVYGNQDHARIVNVNFTARWQILSWLTFNGKAGYSLGKDENGDNLPFISPFNYKTSLDFSYRRYQGQIAVLGNTVHSQYGYIYGESRTPAYTIVNLNSQYTFPLRKQQLTVRLGVENLLDRYYTTYSDWNGIPQKGRNIYANLAFTI